LSQNSKSPIFSVALHPKSCFRPPHCWGFWITYN